MLAIYTGTWISLPFLVLAERLRLGIAFYFFFIDLPPQWLRIVLWLEFITDRTKP